MEENSLACVRWFAANVNMKDFLPNYQLLLQVSIKYKEMSPALLKEMSRDLQSLFITGGNWKKSALSAS